MTEPGTILRRTLLGSTATYRVVGARGQQVELEVIDAPGLQPGFRFEALAADAAAMDVVAGDGDDPPAAA